MAIGHFITILATFGEGEGILQLSNTVKIQKGVSFKFHMKCTFLG